MFSMLQEQYSIETQVLFITVSPYKPLLDGAEDPFKWHDGFGVNLWSEDLGPLEIITPL